MAVSVSSHPEEGFDTALKPHTAEPGGVLRLTELLKSERPGGPCEGGESGGIGTEPLRAEGYFRLEPVG
jgi:hypothetical protein